MTMTYREPPATVEQITELLAEFGEKFSSMQTLDASFERWKAWCRGKGMPLTLEGGRRWLGRDLAQDQVQSVRVLDPDPLTDAHPSTYELTAKEEPRYVASGDLHDWTGIEEPNYEHAAHCRRCQLGEESRRIVDERALAVGKQPFPMISGAALLAGRRMME